LSDRRTRGYRAVATQREPPKPRPDRRSGNRLGAADFRAPGSRSTVHSDGNINASAGVHVRSTVHGSESGQGLIEYALILGVIALLATAAIVFSGVISKNYGSVSNDLGHGTTSQPMTPPAQWPTSVEQCLNGGWRDFPQFSDEASCVRYVTDG
jgi:Flp pilus assembly pilin Flp